jgi:hypothetical protein
MASMRDYRFFRSFSTKIENWSQRKAEALWRKLREKKIAGMTKCKVFWELKAIKMKFDKTRERLKTKKNVTQPKYIF